MIRDFKIYGDVVSFDTTYRTNKEYRPLALFVGLNNHREMVIFGAALLYEESTEAFEWLFNAFFRIMSAGKPQTFITDQDPAICSTVSLHFERSVDDKRANENKSNFDMTQRIPILKVKLPLLIHAREVYTPTIFEMFQNEWEKSLLVSIKEVCEEGESCIYNVCTLGSAKEHSATFNRSVTLVFCSCKLYEFMGILCEHALKILYIQNVKDMIPAHYILKRWTKDATNMNELDVSLVAKNFGPKAEIVGRYRYLCQTFVQISSEASESKERFELAAEVANGLIAKFRDMKMSDESHVKLAPSNSTQNEPSETIFIDNTNVTKVTGFIFKKKQPTRRSNTRPKNFMEKAKKRTKTSLPRSPQRQTDLPSLQVPYPPSSDAPMTTGVEEGSFPPWCPSHISQGSSNGSLSQLLRDVSFQDFNRYSQF